MALLLSVMPMSVLAGGKLEEIRARDVLRVSVKNEGAVTRTEHNDPAHFQKRNFEIELAGHIAKRILGDEKKLDLQVFKRRYRLAAVAEGKVDIGISMFRVDEENRALVDFSMPYYSGGLAVLQKSGAPIRTLADLDGETIVAMEEKSHDPGGELQSLAVAQGVKVNIEHVSRFDDGIGMIESGQAAGMVAMHANLDAFIAAGRSDFRRSPLLSHEEYAVAVRKGDDDLLAAVNETIGELRGSGELAAMLTKYRLTEQ
ncbi:MAG: ABC transporter glutamine-binding protein GlnH [Gammaproteobacteria bacterium]|nr:ABC transporter glutamine-binding protein GlnH [Gammaproteobacteria bacterium]